MTEQNLLQYARWLEWELRATNAEVYRAARFGLLINVPVLPPARMAELAGGPAPSLCWSGYRGVDQKRIQRILAEERSALHEALRRGASALPGLSSFYDPIVRPAAVVSRRDALSRKEIDSVIENLSRAERILAEVVELWSERVPQRAE